ncbi:MAG: heme-binding protein [Dokdonella sp.]
MGMVKVGALLIVASLLVACGGGSNSSNDTGTNPGTDPQPGNAGCTGSCANAQSLLDAGDVRKVIAQAVNEAQAQGTPVVIAVTDRVGNVIGVYRMNGAAATVRIGGDREVVGGLENLDVPTELAAIAKAVTGAYLSSEGNAFSTRTASQIVQDHFNPGEDNTPAGPLFGVQFSQLPCSDLSTRFTGAPRIGPHRSPLGLSADAGGFPLYKNGVPVGGIGGDPAYTFDPNILDRDRDIDEFAAWAGTFEFGAPIDRRADRITVEGKTLRFTDVEFAQLARNPATAPTFDSLGTVGSVIAVPGYFAGTIVDGLAFGQTASGIRPDNADYAGLDAFVLDDGAGNNRYAPRGGTDGANALSANEVRTLVQDALAVANRARAQIRQPLSTPARVSVSVVDTTGTILAMARARDAPIFGIDVSLQKARTALLMSSSSAATDIRERNAVNYFNVNLDLDGARANLFTVGTSIPGQYVDRLQAFLGLPNALTDGALAFTPRATGNLSRPFYPDGIESAPPGPLSNPFDRWSPFSTGLQLDLVYTTLALHVAFYLQQIGLAVNIDGGTDLPALDDVPMNCTGIPSLANGIQIFPGGVPIYRNGTLVGAIGVSGDGIEQDDMVSFLGLHNAGVRLNGAIGNAPPSIRSDTLVPQGARLRYIQCPQAPFMDSSATQVCEGR